jgi:hypothetical protein
MPKILKTIVTPSLQVTGGTTTAGYVLTSDGSGNAEWSAVSATAADGSITTAKLATNETDLYAKLAAEVFG